MIKDSCDFIGWEHILAYNLKITELNWWKNALAYLGINWSLALDYFFIWDCPKGYPKGPLVSLGKFGSGWACKIYPCKKSNKLSVLQPVTCQLKFSQIWGLNKKTENCNVFHFRLLLAKSTDKTPKKTTPFWVLFSYFKAKKNFQGKSTSVAFFVSRFLLLNFRKN